VRVDVDVARNDGLPRNVDDLRARRDLHLALRTNGDHAVVLYHDVALWNDLLARAFHREDASAAQGDRSLRPVLRHGDDDVILRRFIDRPPSRATPPAATAASARGRIARRLRARQRITHRRLGRAEIVAEERMAERVVHVRSVAGPARELATDG